MYFKLTRHTPRPEWVLRPFACLLQLLFAGMLWALHLALHLSCRIEFVGGEHLMPKSNYIFCAWHESGVPWFVAYRRFDRPLAQFILDRWFMWPVGWLVRRMGCKVLIAVASSDEYPLKPTDFMVAYLRDGYSTAITPDGPAGPAKVLKPGVLQIAARSGLTVVPMKASCDRAWTWHRAWDTKRIPLPFSKVKVVFGKPLSISYHDIEQKAAELAAALNAL